MMMMMMITMMTTMVIIMAILEFLERDFPNQGTLKPDTQVSYQFLRISPRFSGYCKALRTKKTLSILRILMNVL